VSDADKTTFLLALLLFGSLAFLWTLSARGGVTRRVSREMQWVDDHAPTPSWSPERRLPALTGGAVRLRFVSAPNSFIVVNYPALPDRLRRLGEHEFAVEFDVGCAIWGGRAQWFNVRSIAGFEVENLASSAGGTESLGNDVDPLSGACDWR
jgi:hypothetical protein